jgi:hypothetical protein
MAELRDELAAGNDRVPERLGGLLRFYHCRAA